MSPSAPLQPRMAASRNSASTCWRTPPPTAAIFSWSKCLTCSVTRREFVAASAAAALSGCSRKPDFKPSPVSVVRAPKYDQSLYDTVRRILALHNLDVRGKRVVLKPNLVEFDSKTTINTHPLLVHAAFEA